MSLSIIVGGLYGDEGKEVVFSYLSLQDRVDAAVRSQGPQHGGKVWYKGEKSIRDYIDPDDKYYAYESDPELGELHKFRQIPAVYNTDAELLLAAGSFVDPEVVAKEVKIYTEWDVESRLKIDKKATVIKRKHKKGDEHLKDDNKSIGSVGTGYRSAWCDRIMARPDAIVENVPELNKYSKGVSVWRKVNDHLDEDHSVLILGVQSTHLSTYFGEYPNTNAYDNTASTILGQVGIGPKRVDNVYLIFKGFVSRVGRGHLEGEIPLEEADRRGWEEYGTVSGRRRRVAPFNYKMAQDSIRLNTPTDLALTKLDILFPEASGITDWSDLPEDVQLWTEEMEKKLQISKYDTIPITLIKTGPRIQDIIDMRKEKGTI